MRPRIPELLLASAAVASAVAVATVGLSAGPASTTHPYVSAGTATLAAPAVQETLPTGEEVGPSAGAGLAPSVAESTAADVGSHAPTGIPLRALAAYDGAVLRTRAEDASCALGWTTLAALGSVESDHGRHGGSALGADGVARPAILGPALDGGRFARIDDSDGGVLDGDATVDRAMGPLQFIPSTWASWGADGDGDGRVDPQDIDDAALAAARYLCADHDLATAGSWRAAVFSYNHDESYVDLVASVARSYADAADG